MRVHLFQYDIVWEDKAANHAIVRGMAERAGSAIGRGDVLVLPEMFDTGFSLNVGDTADAEVDRPGGEPEPGGKMGGELGVSSTFAAALARHHGAWVIAGITLALRGHANERGEPMGVNRALLIDPEGHVAGHYDKIHPFSFGREGERFVPGNAVHCFGVEPRGAAGGTGDLDGVDGCVNLCPLVCYDLRFPELFRAALELPRVPEVYAIIANWPAPRAAHWRALCIARAIENQAFIVAVNRSGRDPHLEYAGSSIVVDPMGVVLAESNAPDPDAAEPVVLSATLDLASLRSWRSKFPALRDRNRWDGSVPMGLAGESAG